MDDEFVCSITGEQCTALKENNGNCIGCIEFDSWAVGTEY